MRTGFAPSFDEIDYFSEFTREQAINYILNSASNPDVLDVPKRIAQPEKLPGKSSTDEEKRAYRKRERESAAMLQSWWLEQMVTTQTPFVEQMTLFWHNHFVSSLQKVKSPSLMLQQNELFRNHALGDYKELVQSVSKDPAMTLYLDNQSNKKSAPNENYARELLELFTLGEGNYTEADIKEAARAFTGWQIDRRTGEFRINKRQHDNGEKVFFDEVGNWQGNNIVDLVFKKKGDQVALQLTRKLWKHFVSLEESPETTLKLSELFVSADFQIKPLLSAMFNSNEFWSGVDSPNLIKSPVDLVVGAQRAFGLNITESSLVRQMGKNMGQMLFAPPNVKGWPGGEAWITSSSLIARIQLLNQVTRAIESQANETTGMMASPYAHITKYNLSEWQQLLLGREPIAYEKPGLTGNASLQQYDDELSAMLQDPAYQLK
jgi:uncharacterized protein (DUF1800 family)